MLKRVIRVILTIFGAIIGYNFIIMLGLANDIVISFNNLGSIFTSTQFIGILVGASVGFFILSIIVEKLLQFFLSFERRFKEITWQKTAIGIMGLIIGLIFGALINFAFSIPKIPRLGLPLQIVINIVAAYLGFSLAISKEGNISDFLFAQSKNVANYNSDEERTDLSANKILDTSVIIDGRIADICKTGFIEGSLIIPEFILEELRHIADSSDVLKRNRGRRGLDILKQMQKDEGINVEIIDKDFEEIVEVDSKLVKLAKIMTGIIVTNDYNLNKVAELQGVRVLNINELANAVKPVVLPGEEMDVRVIKEGKEDGQGIGYLDDGTMIVVDEGVNHIGENISVLVTSILQTAAGRMIFAKLKE
ncbi:MAG: PIN/TRAM domain-containing protein [Bacillota bacterium]